jgi:hypothetical protein
MDIPVIVIVAGGIVATAGIIVIIIVAARNQQTQAQEKHCHERQEIKSSHRSLLPKGDDFNRQHREKLGGITAFNSVPNPPR